VWQNSLYFFVVFFSILLLRLPPKSKQQNHEGLKPIPNTITSLCLQNTAMSDHEQQNFNNDLNNQGAGESATPGIISPPVENNAGALTTTSGGANSGDEDNKGALDQPKEEKVEDNKERINIKVTDGHGGEIWFKVKRSTPMKKIIETFCKKQGKDENSLRFFFDGNRVNAAHTAEELDMEDNDVIEAHHAQLGGSRV